MKTTQASVSTRNIRKAGLWALIAVATVALSTCDVFKVGLGNKVDLTAPSISISSPGRNSSQSGNVTIGGTATDDLGVASVSVRLLQNNVLLTSYSAALSGTSFSAVIPAAAGYDGLVLVEAEAVDAMGKKTLDRTSFYRQQASYDHGDEPPHLRRCRRGQQPSAI